MRRQNRMVSAFISLSLAAAVTLAPSTGTACGYHDDVSMARGMLNWIYPDALHVLGAISAGVAERRLPAPEPVVPDLFGAGYRRTMRALEQLGAELNDASDELRPQSISLVLIEPMLWTRFEAREGKLRPRMHATGPERDDLILVSGEAVIREITNGRLTIGEAHRRGLVRLYGSAGAQTQFLLDYRQVGREPVAAEDARPKPRAPPAVTQAGPMTGATDSMLRLAVSGEATGALACGPGHH